jgi:hypothetical protein
VTLSVTLTAPVMPLPLPPPAGSLPPCRSANGKNLRQLEEKVVRLEARLGPDHRQVGKAWLLMARAYAAEAGPEAAAAADRALSRFRALQSQARAPVVVQFR